jgi:hypothetical protein
VRTVAIENLRRHLGELLRSEEPVLVTRYGKLAGVFYPTPDPRTVAGKLPPVEKTKKTRRKADPQLPLLRGE